MEWLFLILSAILMRGSCQNITCNYTIDENFLYTCDAYIEDSETAQISGSHIYLKSEVFVQQVNIIGGVAPTMPKVFCTTFKNLALFKVPSNVGFSSIETNSFASCKSLVGIIIKNNPLKRFVSNALKSLQSLETFIMTDTLLSSIPPTIFIDNPSIKTIDISNNSLTVWPVELLQTLVNLEDLTVDDNNFVEIPNNAIGSNNLKRLSLKSCKVSQLDSRSFTNLRSLTSLNIDGNQVNAIDVRIFNQAPKLKEVGASNNPCINRQYINFNDDREENMIDFKACFDAFSVDVCE